MPRHRILHAATCGIVRLHNRPRKVSCICGRRSARGLSSDASPSNDVEASLGTIDSTPNHTPSQRIREPQARLFRTPCSNTNHCDAVPRFRANTRPTHWKESTVKLGCISLRLAASTTQPKQIFSAVDFVPLALSPTIQPLSFR
jgi:hypothetical protein